MKTGRGGVAGAVSARDVGLWVGRREDGRGVSGEAHVITILKTIEVAILITIVVGCIA